MPWSARASRDLTESLATIWLTVKCLPTSRRNENSVSGGSQSALLTISARPPPSGPTSMKRANWARMPARFASSCSSVSSERSSDLPPGSPMNPVPPAGHGDGAVPGLLEATERADLEQMADV